jgi:hypothetical protein
MHNIDQNENVKHRLHFFTQIIELLTTPSSYKLVNSQELI